MEEFRQLAERMTAENAEKSAELIASGLRKKYLRSATINAVLNVSQMALSGSIVALNIYVTRYAQYQLGLFVSIVILMSIVTLMTSLSLFLNLRSRARRNRIRYIIAVREAGHYRQEKGYYANPKTKDERIVKRLAQIRAWKAEAERGE